MRKNKFFDHYDKVGTTCPNPIIPPPQWPTLRVLHSRSPPSLECMFLVHISSLEMKLHGDRKTGALPSLSLAVLSTLAQTNVWKYRKVCMCVRASCLLEYQGDRYAFLERKGPTLSPSELEPPCWPQDLSPVLGKCCSFLMLTFISLLDVEGDDESPEEFSSSESQKHPASQLSGPTVTVQKMQAGSAFLDLLSASCV